MVLHEREGTMSSYKNTSAAYLSPKVRNEEEEEEEQPLSPTSEGEEEEEEETVTYHSSGGVTPRKRKFSLANISPRIGSPRTATSVLTSRSLSSSNIGGNDYLRTSRSPRRTESASSTGEGGFTTEIITNNDTPANNNNLLVLTSKRRLLESNKRGSIVQDIRLSVSMNIVQYSATDFGLVTRTGEILLQDWNGNAGDWVKVLSNAIELMQEEALEEEEGLRTPKRTERQRRRRSLNSAVQARRSMQNFIDELHTGVAVRTSLKQAQQQIVSTMFTPIGKDCGNFRLREAEKQRIELFKKSKQQQKKRARTKKSKKKCAIM